MPFNGSGTYSLPPGNPVVTNTTISSTVHNNTNTDIATALTNCLTKDGQSTPTANISMGGFKLTGLVAATSSTDAATAKQIQDNMSKLGGVAGTDTITAQATPSLTAYVTGQIFQFLSAGANTGAATLNIDSLGAKAIVRPDGSALSANDIDAANRAVQVQYNGTSFILVAPITYASNINIVGSNGTTDASAGSVGEYLEGVTAGATAFPSSGVFGDDVSVTLTAGDWDVSFHITNQAGSANITTMQAFIGTATGNNTTGQDINRSYSQVSIAGVEVETLSVSNVRYKVTSSTTLYLKVYAEYTVATPNYFGSITARRIR